METINSESDRNNSFFYDKHLWILLIISLTVRIYLSFFTYVIKNDSVAFLQNAMYFADGDVLSGLRHPYHPLYSFCLTAVYKVIPNMELSGTIVSIFFGTLTVMAFYLIGKSIFGDKISFVSSVILAFHPYAVRFSADIISETTYFFFFISALGLGFLAITKKKFLLFALTGMCSALAYLTRPEGIGIIIIVAGWTFFKDLNKIRLIWKDKIASLLILIATFLLFSSPYLVFIKCDTGKWLLTMKRNLSQTKIVMPENRNRDKGVQKSVSKTNSGENIKKQTIINNKTDMNSLSKDFEQKKPGTKIEDDADVKVTEENVGKTKQDVIADKQTVTKKTNSSMLLKDSQKKESGVEKKSVKNVKFVKRTFKGLSFKTYLESLLYVISKYISTFHPFAFVFFIIGVINWTRIKKERFFGFYITTIIVFYMIILYRLNIINIAVYGGIHQYPSRRHVMPIVILAIFCAGLGVYTTGTWMQKKYQNSSVIIGFKELLKSTWIMQLIVLMIVVSVFLPKTLKPQRFKKLGIIKAGQWVKENSNKSSPLIFSASARNAYYAGGRHIQMGGDKNQILTAARAKKADYLLISYREHNAIAKELQQAIKDKKVELAYKYPEEESLNRRSILLYEVLY